LLYVILKALAFFLLRVGFLIEVRGRRHVPKEGGVIVVSNHCSNMDPVIVGAVLPRKLYYMAKEELFKIPFLRKLITSLGAFPVKRGEGDVKALSKVAELVRSGNAVLLFPEGSRSEDGRVGKFMHGASYVALRTGAPVLPVAIKGSFEAMPRGSSFPKPTRIKVEVGEPMFIRVRKGSVKEDVCNFTNRMREVVCWLLEKAGGS